MNRRIRAAGDRPVAERALGFYRRAGFGVGGGPLWLPIAGG